MPALSLRVVTAATMLFTGLHLAFALMQSGVTSVVGTSAATLIFGLMAWTIHRGGRRAAEPHAFVRFAVIATASVALFFSIWFITIATGVNGSSHFADPTAWNRVIASIRTLCCRSLTCRRSCSFRHGPCPGWSG